MMMTQEMGSVFCWACMVMFLPPECGTGANNVESRTRAVAPGPNSSPTCLAMTWRWLGRQRLVRIDGNAPAVAGVYADVDKLSGGSQFYGQIGADEAGTKDLRPWGVEERSDQARVLNLELAEGDIRSISHVGAHPVSRQIGSVDLGVWLEAASISMPILSLSATTCCRTTFRDPPTRKPAPRLPSAVELAATTPTATRSMFSPLAPLPSNVSLLIFALVTPGPMSMPSFPLLRRVSPVTVGERSLMRETPSWALWAKLSAVRLIFGRLCYVGPGLVPDEGGMGGITSVPVVAPGNPGAAVDIRAQVLGMWNRPGACRDPFW